MIAWSNSAPSAGTGMPNARKHTANPAALTSHNTNDHATTPANRPGRRSSSSPPINPSASRTSRSASRAGSTPWVILLKKESQGAGRCTTARATSRAAPNTIAPPPATRLTDVPPITASRGKDGAAIASAISPTITNPSITRSTPMEAKAVVKRTGSCRLATYARANSPAREGNEVADFFDEGAQALARGRTGFLAQLLGALLGALATVEQGEDVHDVGFRGDAPARGGGTGWPCGVRRGRRSRDLARRSDEI